MKYLSLDIEATGLRENDLIIEIAFVPFDTATNTIETKLALHTYVSCPPFLELKPTLDQWVIDHNQTLIEKAHSEGIPLKSLSEKIKSYVTSPSMKEYFNNEKIVLFGKSMNAIDLPFLNRDLGWNFMRDNFSHRTADLTSITYGFIDQGLLPKEAQSGSTLMKLLEMGDVAHTALEDSINTAKMYLKMIEKSKAR